MKVYKWGVNNNIRNMVKGAKFQSESILCSVGKGEIVRSIALADTRENRNIRAVLYTNGIVQWKCQGLLATVKCNVRDF